MTTMSPARRCSRCGVDLGSWEFGACPHCLLGPSIELSQPPPALSPGASDERIGPYRLIERLPSHGMGIIYLAEQDAPRRLVAIKVIRDDLHSETILARFERELEAIASMDHPGIAKVYDAMRFPDGRPCFVMEFVDGLPITRYAVRHDLSLTQRLELFLDVCAAVLHAHQRGVIHRDIKPTNILVGTVDGRPQAKLIDFGLARALGAVPGTTLDLGAVAGTLGSMSPEQTYPGMAFDTRSDVYGLGIVLYELLAGVPPFLDEEIAGKPIDTVFKLIREVDPPFPSKRASSIAMTRDLSGDLDAIVMKAIAKEKTRRYPDVVQLAEDIERHRRSEPVRARPAGRLYRLGRFIRRHRVEVGLAATVSGLLAVAMVLLVMEKRRADERSEDALATAAFLANTFIKADPRGQDPLTMTVREAVTRAAESVLANPNARPRVQGFLLSHLGMMQISLSNYARAENLLEEALKVLGSSVGTDSPDYAEALVRLAEAENRRNKLAEAKEHFRAALLIREHHYGKGSLPVAEVLAGLGDNSWFAGDYSQARDHYQNALEIERRLRGPHDPKVANRLRDLGDVAWAQLDYVSAADYYDQARAILVEQDRNSIFVGVLDNNLGGMLLEQRRWDEARPKLENALRISEMKQGRTHVDVAETLDMVGVVAAHYGNLARAESLFRRALELSRDPSKSVQRAEALDGLGAVALERGELLKAEDFFRGALEAWGADKSSQPGRSATLVHQARLAVLRHDRRQARRLLEEALALRRNSFGEDHPQVLEIKVAMESLGSM